MYISTDYYKSCNKNSLEGLSRTTQAHVTLTFKWQICSVRRTIVPNDFEILSINIKFMVWPDACTDLKAHDPHTHATDSFK